MADPSVPVEQAQPAANRPTRRTGAPSVSKVSITVRFVLLVVLAFVLIGTLLFPYWWYVLIMGGKLGALAHWAWGINFVIEWVLPPLLLVGLCGSIVTYAFWESKTFRRALSRLPRLATGRIGNWSIAILLISVVASLAVLHVRAQPYVEMYKRLEELNRSSADLRKSIDDRWDKTKERPPLNRTA